LPPPPPSTLVPYTTLFRSTCLVPDEDGKPQPLRLGLKDILRHFLDFRFETVKRRFEYELEQLKKRIHILTGFKIVFNALDRAIKDRKSTRLNSSHDQNSYA